MNKENWEDLYVQAALEVDKAKMAERISLAREAIQERLHDLEESTDHGVERSRMGIALKNLAVLETESETW